MLVRSSCAFAAVLAIAPSPVHADDAAPAAPPPPPPSRARRALAAAAAIVPGVVVRGAGHWVAGERRTARRLLVIEGVGLALAAAGGIALGASGGADETLPALAIALPGGGLLLTSIAADIWGAAGGACIAGTTPPLPAVDAGVGYTFLGDPRVPFANLATVDATARRDRFAAAVSGWLGDGTWRARGAVGVRVRGPRPGERPADTSALDLEVSASEERRADQGLRVGSVDVAARARIDLARVGPSLRGTFVTLGLGAGLERARYPATGAADTSGLVNARLGWGFALGDGVARSLETELYYEHGRDTLAGGLTLRLPANGFIGYVGAVTTAWHGRYGASVRLDVGSAYVLALSARIRLPELSP